MKKQSVVILHGWASNPEKYLPLIKILEKKYKVYIPFLPGFDPKNRLNKPWTLDVYANYLNDYLKRHKIKNFYLIGHSFGGRIALRMLSQNDIQPKLLILTGVPGLRSDTKLKRLALFFIAKSAKVIFKLPPMSFFAPVLKKILYRLIKAPDYQNTRNDKNLRETFKSIIKDSLTEDMRNIKTPTYLIWGIQDKIVPVKIAQKMKNIIRNSSLILIHKGGHNVLRTHPRIFVKYLPI